MTRGQVVEAVKQMDAECTRLDKSIQAARRRYEHALYELIQTERDHAAAIQRRTAFEGRHSDLLQPAPLEPK
jgi:hypothetical protein